MNVQISSPNFAITDSIKENLNRVIRKITLMNNQVQSVAVSLKKEGNEYIVILRAKMKGTNSTAVIKKRSQNFYTALASVYSTVLHTLKKKRDKRYAQKNRNLRTEQREIENLDLIDDYVN